MKRILVWLFLAVVCLGVIVPNLLEYSQRAPASSGPSVEDAERQFEMQAMLRSLSPTGTGTGVALQTVIGGLDKSSGRESVRFRSALRLMLSESVPAKDLARLKEGGEVDRALARLSDPELTKAEAEGIASAHQGSKAPTKKIVVALAHEKTGGTDRWKAFANPGKAALFGIVVLALFGGAVLGLLVLLIEAVRKPDGPRFAHPIGVVEGDQLDQLGLTAAMMLLGFFGGQFLGGVAFSALAGTSPAFLPLVFATGGLLAVAAIRAGGWSLRDVGVRDFGFDKLVGGFAGWCANLVFLVPAIALVSFLSRFLPAAEQPIEKILGGGMPGAFAGVVISACIMAPIFEEIMFRGVLLPALIQKFRSIPMGLIVTNLIFASVHGTGVVAWPALFTVGLTASLLTLRTRSLYPAMILHALHNSMSMTFLYLMTS